MRKILQFWVALALCLGLAVSARGAAPLLADEADLLTESQENDLRESLEQLRQKRKMDVVVVTVDSLEGKTAESFADDYYDYGGYAEDGVLLLVAMTEREWHITTSGSAIAALSDDDLEALSQKFLPDLSAGNYSGAFAAFVKACDGYLKPQPKLPPISPFLVIVSLAVGVGAAFVTTGSMKKQLKNLSPQTSASSYLRSDSLHLTQSQDVFLYQTLTRTPRPKNTPSSHSSGTTSHSTTHTSSSGTSHGGSGGHF